MISALNELMSWPEKQKCNQPMLICGSRACGKYLGLGRHELCLGRPGRAPEKSMCRWSRGGLVSHGAEMNEGKGARDRRLSVNRSSKYTVHQD